MVLLLFGVLAAWVLKTGWDNAEKDRRFSAIVPTEADFPPGTLDGEARGYLKEARNHEAERVAAAAGVTEAWRDRENRFDTAMERLDRAEDPGWMPTLIDSARVRVEVGNFLLEQAISEREGALVDLGIHRAASGQRLQGVRVFRRVCRLSLDEANARAARNNLENLGEEVPAD